MTTATSQPSQVPHASGSLVRLSPPRALIGDTGELMKEVCRSLRQQHQTSLLAALHLGTVRMYIPRHVLDEMTVGLPIYTAETGAAAADAVERWDTQYLPRIRVVDVAGNWGNGDPRVAAVEARDQSDLPTARLAVTLRCPVITEDGDLVDNGIGSRKWLKVAHFVANEAVIDETASMVYLPTAAAIGLTRATTRLIARAPVWAQLALCLVASVGITWCRVNGRGARQVQRAADATGDLWQWVGPRLVQMLARRVTGELAWVAQTVVGSNAPTMSERVAALLSVATDPPLAEDLARGIERPGNLRDRTQAVRAILVASPAFCEASRGRWALGQPATNADLPASTAAHLAWFAQAVAPKQLPAARPASG